MAKITLSLLQRSREKFWENFLDESVNSTFYQDLKFLMYYSYKIKEVLKIIFQKGNTIIAVLPAGLFENNKKLELCSPFSASFGGICYDNKLKLKDAYEIIHLLINYCKQNNICKISIQQPPQIYYKTIDEYIEFALNNFGFKITRMDLTLFLKKVDNLSNWVSASVRRNVRRAENNNLIFREMDSIEEVYNLIKHEKDRKKIPFSISLIDLKNLKDLFPDRIKTFGVFMESTLIAGIILYLLNDRAAMGFSWAHDETHQLVRPTDFMLFNAINWVFQRGFIYFDFGTCTINGNPVWGVTRFKENYSLGSASRKKFELVLEND